MMVLLSLILSFLLGTPMHTVEELSDGSRLVTMHPSKWMLERPTYGMWLKYLLSRDAAVRYMDKGRENIKTITTQPARMVDGQARVMCINCGLPWLQWDMNGITIGALVRIPEEEVTGPMEVTRKQVIKPVSKRGLGCPACQVVFQQEVKRVDVDNAIRRELATLQAQYAQLTGNPVKLAAELKPWIDVFDPAIGEGTKLIWRPSQTT